MAIDFDLFVEWAESRFNDIIVKGNEIKLNSIFCEDSKHHLWCNPSGGRNNVPYGVFHCWKTDTKGSLVSLVMEVDKCSFEQALETLESANHRLEDLEKQVHDILSKKQVVSFVEIENTKLKIPDHTYFFDDLPSSNNYKKKAEEYLNGRKISTDNLMICVGGEYRNRIIIPYYNKKGDLIYYNGRYVGDNTSLRYLGPPKELGIGKSDVLYVPKWFENGEIMLTEGEFDAITLFQCGMNSAAFGGKELSDAQILLLRPYEPTLCLDADIAGGNALINMGDLLLQKGFNNVSYVRAPKEHKDWNKMYELYGEKIVRAYVKQNKKHYNNFVSVELKNKRLLK